VGARGKWWLLVGAGLLASGCQPRPPSAEELAELEQVKAERAALNESFDQLEIRLLEGQALVSRAELLKERHGQVSQVACQNLSDHWQGITRFLDNQREKTQQKRRASLAQAELHGRE
jgi:hypothetical protein